ncbi:MAG: biopolymer transporter ExbD [Candidatus Latescibacteria bacterium]|nr:biopolymer transporter ExbD [Candidatus Latescibacterota bacterium]
MAYVRKKGSVLESDKFDMTPLIDAVFLLLIFFMVTTVFKNPAQLKMTLPDATHPSTLEKKQIVVEVDADANIAINGNEVSFESFEAYLAQEKYSSGNNTILIRADVDTKHGDILKLMKMARSQQIETMAMAVKDLSEEE